MKRLCTKCKERTPRDEKHSECRPCIAEYSRQYRIKYRDKVTKAQQERRERANAIRRDAKDKPCIDCGIKYPPYVMDFDHTMDKRFSIGTSGQKYSVAVLKIEIEKCDVVCANCHRIRTFARLKEL